jgi:hypothetical protein
MHSAASCEVSEVDRDGGFTLIELLVDRHPRRPAAAGTLQRQVVRSIFCCLSNPNLRQLQAGCLMYAGDNNDSQPPVLSQAAILPIGCRHFNFMGGEWDETSAPVELTIFPLRAQMPAMSRKTKPTKPTKEENAKQSNSSTESE